MGSHPFVRSQEITLLKGCPFTDGAPTCGPLPLQVYLARASDAMEGSGLSDRPSTGHPCQSSQQAHEQSFAEKLHGWDSWGVNGLGPLQPIHLVQGS